MKSWWMLAVLTYGSFISYMHRLGIGVLVDPMRAELQISDTQVSLLQGAAFALIYVFAGLFFGRLADTVNRRLLLLAGATVWSLGTMFCGLAGGFAPLFLARCIVGIGEATLAPAAASMIADRFPPARQGIALALFLAGTVLGGPAAAAIGGPLLDALATGALPAPPLLGALAPWRIVLVLFGLAGLPLPLLLLTVQEPPRKLQDTHPTLRQALQLLGGMRRVLVPLLLGVALLSIGDYALFTWVPSSLGRGFGWQAAEIGLWFGGVTSWGALLGVLLGGVASDAVERRRGVRGRLLLVIVAGLAGGGGALLFFAQSASLQLVGLGIWMLASAMGSTSGIAALLELVQPTMRGSGMSLVAFCNTLLGLGAGPTAVALVSDASGGRIAIGAAIAGVVAPAGLLAALLILRASRVVR